MDAHDTRLTQLIDGQKQFIIPVFQRDYSWGTKHCLQLWRDIARVGSEKSLTLGDLVEMNTPPQGDRAGNGR